MLEVKDLHASVNGKEILKGINLSIKKGEIHAIMGPNGSGKSTLSSVLVGHPSFEVTKGTVTFDGQNLLDLSPEDRSHAGLFLSFQYPVEIPGVSMVNFMRAAVNEKRKYEGKPALTASEFLKLMREKRAVVELDNKLANRSVNEGFSGGEKKRNEIFQMAMLEPKLSILDETDSGLDIDALRIVAEGVNKLKTPETSCIVITHYQRLLDYIKPDVVHVLYKGRIVKTAGPELALEIENSIENDPLTQTEYNEKTGQLYQMWDSDLNAVWRELKVILDAESFEEALFEQREWIATKEAEVKAAGAEVEGGSMQPMVMNMKAAELTKIRVYELLEYFE